MLLKNKPLPISNIEIATLFVMLQWNCCRYDSTEGTEIPSCQAEISDYGGRASVELRPSISLSIASFGIVMAAYVEHSRFCQC